MPIWCTIFFFYDSKKLFLKTETVAFLPYTCTPHWPSSGPSLVARYAKGLKIFGFEFFCCVRSMLHPSANLQARTVTPDFYASYTLRLATCGHLCGSRRVPICHCQICNFSSIQSEMAGPPRYFINNLQITAEQKMVMHRSEREPRPGRESFLSRRSIPMKNVMCHCCNRVCACVCVRCVPKGRP